MQDKVLNKLEEAIDERNVQAIRTYGDWMGLGSGAAVQVNVAQGVSVTNENNNTVIADTDSARIIDEIIASRGEEPDAGIELA